MALTDFAVENYRSIRDVWLKLQPVNVVIGPNGSGKSNLYRAIYLVSCAARGQFASALAEEGGIQSVLFAGPRKERGKRETFKLSVRVGKFEYNLECGVCGDVVKPGFFAGDPEIKKEEVFIVENGERHGLLERRRRSIWARNAAGKQVDYTVQVPDNESILTGLNDPLNFPQLSILKEEFLSWRFYHHFRTDEDSPLRLPRVGVMTPALSDDAHDLAAVLATILEAGRSEVLLERLEEAFPGANLDVRHSNSGLKLSMQFPEFARAFEARELSDGTLQYLCLLAALLPLKPAPLIALNEPETSLHPRLIEPLAQLIVDASSQSQIWVTTHSRELADAILDKSGYDHLELKKDKGETKLVGVGLGGYVEEDDE